jgi:hypothetical protein
VSSWVVWVSSLQCDILVLVLALICVYNM